MRKRGTEERHLRPRAHVARLVTLLLVVGFTIAIPSALAVHSNGLFELDGNAIDEASAGADWSTAVNGGTPNQISKVFVSDPFNDSGDNIFTGGGSKDDLDIPNWQWTTGSPPDKDDLEHAYAAGYTDANGHLIVYFGADRYATSGDSNLGFWFTKNGITPNGDGTFSAPHADGDLFVVSEFTQGGATPVISVYKWASGGLTQLTTAAGCTPDDSACAIVNSGDAAAPWSYSPKAGTEGTFPAGAFFEGGVDLTMLFGGNDNLPCVHSFLAETRSSDSLNAVLKDFASGSFNLCAEIITDKVTNPSGSPQSFAFSTTGPNSFSDSFSLTDAAAPHSSGQVKPGTYSTSETVPAGWAQTGATCSDGSPANAIAVGPGETVTCTFSNARQPTLTVIKHVVNDNGGSATASQWSMHVQSGGSEVTGSPFNGAESPGTTLTLAAGSYNVSESGGPAGYAATFSGACDSSGNVSLALGDTKTCTITNNDVGPTLTVIKHVVNDNGASATASQWSMHIKSGGSDVSGSPFAGAESPGTTRTLSVGSYVVSESDGPSGYSQTGISGDCNASGAVTLALGESKTCTITNNDVAPTLTVIKHVVNDNGGSAVASSWSMHVQSGGSDVSGSPFPGAESPGTTKTLSSGAYVISESGGPSGYAATIGGDCDSSGNVVLGPGQSKTCTITNNDVAPTLTVIKHVVNDNGGSATASQWSMHVKSGGSDVSGSPFPGAESPGTTKTLSSGSYVVSESGGPSGYAATISGDCSGSGAVTLSPGQNKTCTITNNDIAPGLTVIKHVVNDNGGSATASQWSMHVKSGGSDVSGSPFAGSEAGTAKTLSAGAYVVSESDGPTGYVASFSGDCDSSGNVTLDPGESKTCTITNNDVAPTLTVIKHVVNDDGGSATASQWSMHIKRSGSDVSGSPFPGAESPGTTKTVNAGSLVVSESGGPSGYAATIGGDCDSGGNVTLGPGQSKTCTITNNDVAPTLTVIKHVVNDNGGSATASQWSMHVKSGASDVTGSPFSGAESPGTTKTLSSGSYAVSESDGPSGYVASFSGDCDSSGNVTLGPGQTKTCTITNNDVAPGLTVIKHVVNDNGGTADANDWSMHVKSGGSDVSGSPFPGSEAGTTKTLSAGSYVVSESGGPSGYAASFSGDCDSSGNVTLGSGDSKVCTITNNDIAPSLTVIKHVVNDNGGTADANDWSMHVQSGGSDVAGSPFPGAESPGTTKTVDAGNLVVSESGGPSGYTASFSGDCNSSGNVTLGPGESKTCTVTNNDQAAHLLVKKHVINDNGGTSIASDFTLNVSGESPSPASFTGDEGGVSVTINAGDYDVTEGGHAGYSVSFSADCEGTIGIGEEKTCTVTNDDQAAHLLVKKHVINDNGGTATASGFTLTVAGQSPSPASFPGSESGVEVTLKAGAYSVTEGAHAGYTLSFSPDCSGSMAVGQTKTCTVTNDDIAAPPPPPPSGSPLIDLAITKTDNPDPVQVGAQLTYTLTVTNKKGDTANGVVVTDSLPSEVTLISVTSTKGSCSGTTAITCQIGTVAYQEVVVITIVVRPNVAGTISNTAVVAGREAEHNPADNTAREPTVVQGPFTPPSVCYGLTVTPRSMTVGRRTIVRVTVREAGKPVARVRVVITGRRLTKQANTNARGVARFVITARNPGILQIRVPNHKTCNRQRIGVLGVFTPPVTG